MYLGLYENSHTCNYSLVERKLKLLLHFKEVDPIG